MIMLSRFSKLPDELSENDELREYELSGSDCIAHTYDIYSYLSVPLLIFYTYTIKSKNSSAITNIIGC